MITILTATYNRGHCLSKLYESLLQQTSISFEWIVIDDGSIDNTEVLVRKWQDSTKNFSIKYVKKENEGKHRAINLGVNMSQGKYIFIVDSDDYLSDDAIEKILQWTNEIDDLPNFAGVSGVRARINTDRIIGEFPQNVDYIDASNIDRKKYHLSGDKAEVYKTSLLKMYPFPEINSEKFIGESVVWDELAHDGYLLRWHKDIIYYCNYLEDGLTKNYDKIIIDNPKGYALVKSKVFHYYSFPIKWIALFDYINYSFTIRLGLKSIKSNMNITWYELCIGIIFYKIWKYARSIKIYICKFTIS